MSGAGLAGQRTALEAHAERQGWLVVQYVEEVASGRDLDRPGLRSVLDAVTPGDLVAVAKLDRLSRSVLDFALLLEEARGARWHLVALDLGVDTSTPTGELVASVMMSVAQWERRIIGERTRTALAARKLAGVRLGRPPETPAEVERTVVELRQDGYSWRAIARLLTADAVPTARGGATWDHSTVANIYRRATGENGGNA